MNDVFKTQIQSHHLSHSYLLVGQDKDIIDSNIELMVSELKISSIDRFTIYEEGSIKIASIRKLHNWLSLKSYNSKYKLAIIKNAESLTIESANALLKILEETPDQSIIILVTYNKSKIIPTVISRCRVINLNNHLDIYSNNQIQVQVKNEIDEIINMTVGEKFSFVDSLIKNDDTTIIIKKLTGWLNHFKKIMLSSNNAQKVIKEIQKSQKLLQSTNVNKKLLLENLILII